MRWSQAGRRQESVAGLTASIRRPLSQLAAGRSAAVRGGSRRAGRPVAHSLDPRRRLHTCVTAAASAVAVVGSLIASRRPALPRLPTMRQTDRPTESPGRPARPHVGPASSDLCCRRRPLDRRRQFLAQLVASCPTVHPTNRLYSSCLLQRLLIFVHASDTIYIVCPQ